ncbi:hypothetical protein DITRI_Ditri01bG0142800 [Diplodiscus trichospermus]
MTGKEILHKMKEKVQEKVGLGSSADSGRGKSKMSKKIIHGYHLVEGKSRHPMEDYVVAEFKQVGDNELGLFAIFDGHLSQIIPNYLKSHLFNNILNEPDFWTQPENAIRKAYRITDASIMEKAVDLGEGGSTAVTAILINCEKLVIANVGDSRAVICKNGKAKQLSVDHEPSTKKERERIENKGGFVSNFPGNGCQSLFFFFEFGNCINNFITVNEPFLIILLKIKLQVLLSFQGTLHVLTGSWQWQGHLVIRA